MGIADVISGEQQVQKNPFDDIISGSKNEQEAMGKAYLYLAQKAMQRGLADQAGQRMKMAKMLGVGGSDATFSPRTIEKVVNGKKHYFSMNPNTGMFDVDQGEVPPPIYKEKNIIGRGWFSKRPIMQSNEHGGRPVYADTMGDAVEFANPADMKEMRPVHFKDLGAGQADQLSGLKNTYDRLDSVIERVKKNPKAMAKFGPVAGNWNALKIKFMNEGETQALQNELKSFITIAYGLSGKQISDSEMQRLQDALLPHLAQPGDNFLSTAEFARDWVANLHNDKMDYFDKAGFESRLDKLKPKGYTFNNNVTNGRVGRFQVTVE